MKREAYYGWAPVTAFTLIAGLMLGGCSTVQPYADSVTSSGAYQATAEFVEKYHEGTPCSSYRYNDFGC